MRFFFLFAAFGLLLAACSFNYGDSSADDGNKPDIVMEKLEYVRVRGGDPKVRFQAEYAERWEESQTMALRNFTFEQFEDKGDSVNAEGRAGAATVQLKSGNISLSRGVRISIDSEDITIRTAGLEWKDKERILSGGSGDEVDVERSDGTSFQGRGFTADARNRTWVFSGEVKGSYVETENEEEAGEEEERAGAEEIWTWSGTAAGAKDRISSPEPAVSVPDGAPSFAEEAVTPAQLSPAAGETPARPPAIEPVPVPVLPPALPEDK